MARGGRGHGLVRVLCDNREPWRVVGRRGAWAGTGLGVAGEACPGGRDRGAGQERRKGGPETALPHRLESLGRPPHSAPSPAPAGFPAGFPRLQGWGVCAQAGPSEVGTGPAETPAACLTRAAIWPSAHGLFRVWSMDPEAPRACGFHMPGSPYFPRGLRKPLYPLSGLPAKLQAAPQPLV